MNSDQQFWAALAVVIVTAGVFVFRFFRRKKSGCEGGCGCSVAPRKVGLPKVK